jgi:hypothetical protein
MSGHRPSESYRRDIIERNVRKEVEHEQSKGRKPDVRKIEENWRNVARDEDRKRGWS